VSDLKRKLFLDSAVFLSGSAFVPIPLGQLTGHETRRPMNLVMVGNKEIHKTTSTSRLLSTYRFSGLINTKSQARNNCKYP